MAILLRLAEVHIPVFMKRRKLASLFAATAGAFGSDMPDLAGLSLEECLDRYARFTREEADKVLRSGEYVRVRQRLYDNSYRLGAELRQVFGVRGMANAMRLAKVIYDIVGIDFKGEESGEVTIARCFFSGYYSPEVCDLVSSLDAGLLAGISGGARLRFSERMTDGCGCCRARLSAAVRTS